MDVEIRHLRALAAVVDEGGFTHAGAALDLSQASVSRTVSALEDLLGVRLLDRSTRRPTPTPEGVHVLEHARRVLEEVAALRRAAESGSTELRVGYAWAALGRRTTSVLRRWGSAHPGTELVLVRINTRTAGLAEGLCDVGILRLPLEDRRFRSVLVGVEARYAALPADDPLARRRSVRLDDLSGRTIATDAATGTTSAELWRAGSGPGGTVTTHDVDEWLTVIEAGRAFGITTEATMHQHPRPGVVFRPVKDAPPVPVTITWRADVPPRAVSDLVDLVLEAYSS
ncbi:MAG TPA: LysR family transcriptional regulator [Candidatus Nanopelagicales bacterium]|nr:LysR family transcriptional regulator [Candidatus Nanopelagicales bacterium]